MKSDVALKLAEAQSWHLLALLFERPRGQWREQVRELGAGTDDDLREAAALAGHAEEGRYLRSIGPTGVVSPREVGHCGMRDPGQLLAELRARYGAFGFQPATEDSLDHVAVEVDFVSYLRFKEAYALAQGEDEHAALAAEAAASFIEDHLRVMGEPMAAKLEGVAQPYLARAARVLAGRAGSAPPPASARIIWMDDEDTMECADTEH